MTIQPGAPERPTPVDQVSAPVLDLWLAYPELTEAHRDLRTISREAFLHAEANIGELDIRKERTRLEKFFGLEGNSVVLPAAAEAIGATIQHFTQPGSGVLLLDPAWPFYNREITDTGGGERTVVRVESKDEGAIEKAITSNSVSLIILNTPRNPDMHTYSREFLVQIAQLADKHGVTILYDEVFCFFDEETSIERDGESNTIRRDIPRSKSHAIIRDTGKILPDPFPKVAVLHISEAARQNGGGEALLRQKQGQHNNDPSIVSIYQLNQVLRSEEFPAFLSDVKALAHTNFEALSEMLDTYVKECGPMAMVYMGEQADDSQQLVTRTGEFGLRVFQLSDFYGSREGVSPFIRVPLISDPEVFIQRMTILEEKLRRMNLSLDAQTEVIAARLKKYTED